MLVDNFLWYKGNKTPPDVLLFASHHAHVDYFPTPALSVVFSHLLLTVLVFYMYKV